MIYFFTGQPGSGKTTLAKIMVSCMTHAYTRPFHIDGDDIREIFQNKDYSEAGRRKNIELAQNIAHFIHKKDGIAVVSLIAPYKDQRDAFKKLIGPENYKEIYVHTTAQRGREDFHVKDYQPPTEDFVDIDTTTDTVMQSLNKILKGVNFKLFS